MQNMIIPPLSSLLRRWRLPVSPIRVIFCPFCCPSSPPKKNMQVKIESTKLAYENDTVTDLSKPPSLPQQQPFQPTGASANTAPSVIIYASRTHSQLGQVRLLSPVEK